MKFIVIHDDLLTKFPEMNLSVLDLKNRYVNICKINEQIYGSSNAQQWHFDSDYEKQRRYLLDKYQKQTLKEIEKEQYIEHELSKIHARRDEMKKKLESLVGDTSYKPQNMMDNYENGKDEHSEKSEESNGNIPTSINPPYDATHAHKKYKLATRKIHPNTSDTSNTSVNPATKITSLCNKIFNPYKFPDNRPVGISLRSQRYKIPQSVGSRRIKALSSALLKLNIGILGFDFYNQFSYNIYPPATREVCEIYCALRSDLIALYDLKHALISLEFEYQKLKHKFYTSCPDVSFPFKDDPIENFKISYIDDVSYNIKADK
ncbi:hypothetical protein HZS_4814 [Henneguya salminicola]|nr:hypothetical protein HZS_4814 [Henneguya salminicola]